MLVKVNELVFPADFVILDMAKDEDMPLIIGRPFLATGCALIDVEMGQLMLRFHNEQVVFNIFEAMKHRAEILSATGLMLLMKSLKTILVNLNQHNLWRK